MEPESWSLFGSIFNGKNYWNVYLPFGGFNACGTLSRFTDPLEQAFHERNLICSHILDDFAFVTEPGPIEQANLEESQVDSILADLGWTSQEDKAIHPCKHIKWFGIIFDSTDLTIDLPEPKISFILDLLSSWLAKHSTNGKITISPDPYISPLGKMIHVTNMFFYGKANMFYYYKLLSSFDPYRVPHKKGTTVKNRKKTLTFSPSAELLSEWSFWVEALEFHYLRSRFKLCYKPFDTNIVIIVNDIRKIIIWNITIIYCFAWFLG